MFYYIPSRYWYGYCSIGQSGIILVPVKNQFVTLHAFCPSNTVEYTFDGLPIVRFQWKLSHLKADVICNRNLINNLIIELQSVKVRNLL